MAVPRRAVHKALPLFLSMLSLPSASSRSVSSDGPCLKSAAAQRQEAGGVSPKSQGCRSKATQRDLRECPGPGGQLGQRARRGKARGGGRLVSCRALNPNLCGSCAS